MNARHSLIRRVREHPTGFYRSHWGTVETFEELPLISRAEFIRTPLSQRRYKDTGGFTKIIHAPDGHFAVQWSFEDIRNDVYGRHSRRPMVFLTDPHESVEKGLWFFLNRMTPLIGERNADIACFSARRFDIDSLLADEASLDALRPYLESRRGPLECMTVLGDSFDVEKLTAFVPYAREIRLVLSSPETGAFAEAPFAREPFFAPYADAHIEYIRGELVLTRTTYLVTPLIRYRTGIQASNCGARMFTIFN